MVILVVDDDPAVRDALKFSLELEDFKVHVCQNGGDLLAHPALRQSNCIVLDYKMPGMDGLDVLAKLSSRAISTPVIFITGPVTNRSGNAPCARAHGWCWKNLCSMEY